MYGFTVEISHINHPKYAVGSINEWQKTDKY